MELYEGYYVKLKRKKELAKVKQIYHYREWNDTEVVNEHYEFTVDINDRIYRYEDVQEYAETKEELLNKLKKKAKK